MSLIADFADAAVADDELISGLNQALRESMAAKSCVTDLVRQPSSYQSSYPLEELTVVCDDGKRLNLIFKNVSPRALSPAARRAKPEFLDDRRREIAVYRSILDAANLGTPRYYGSLVDETKNRYWLFLEKAAGHELYQVGDTSLWLSAARWLARFHERIAGASDLPAPIARALPRFDALYYQRWFDRAVQFARERKVADVRRAAIERLAILAPRIIAELVDLPMTFIHGEFYASNVLVDNSGQAVRICPVDWERAAIGPGLIDLAALVAGRWPEKFKRHMAAAYHDELLHSGTAAPAFKALLRGLNLCRFLLAIQWLGWSLDWMPPKEHQHDWLNEAQFAARELNLTT